MTASTDSGPCMGINRVLVNVLSDDLVRARGFYTELFGFQVNFEEDWWVYLSAPANPALELGIWKRDHELVPEGHRGRAQGMIFTIIVDDVDDVHEQAVKLGVPIVAPPRDQFYGQRSCLMLDPDGVLVDVSSPI
ncbi:hypothetical protein FDA94_00275 [Herbidospora galbida]|uniref:VOC domain-containing protein n=1 Tax=Herbidospora galbida TaxID=2575442 RepID=A0A4U3MNQ8_9ACTN|nr:VOC family protein [Herbidospora galbida]TKK91288.1 hypothetical protein FDA94_00275 [Herbidospora galbida]